MAREGTAASLGSLVGALSNLVKVVEQEPKKGGPDFGDTLASYYGDLVERYEKEDWRGHGASMLTLIAHSRHFPAEYLSRYQHVLGRFVAKHGVDPYLAWFIEYGYRLLFSQTKRSLELYRDLGTLFWKHSKFRPNRSAVPMRSKKGRTYRLYSANIGYAVAVLLFSAFGEGHAAIGYDLHHYVRIVALLSNCRRRDDLEKSRTSPYFEIAEQRTRLGTTDTCAILAKAIKDRLDAAQSGGLDSAMADIGRNGITIGGADCLNQLIQDDRAEFIGRFEDYVRCQSNHRREPGWERSWVFDGDGNVSESWTSFPWFGMQYNQVAGMPGKGVSRGSYTYGELYESMDGSTIAFAGTEYNDGERGDTTIDFFDANTGNKTETGVVRSDGTVKSDTTYDAKGNVATQTEFDEQGRMSSHTDSSGTATYTYNNDGTTTVTTTTKSDDGSSTTVTTTVDGDGKETGQPTIVTTPAPKDGKDPEPDGYVEDPCAGTLFKDPRKESLEKQINRLGPWINPNPEGTNEPTLDNCLEGFLNSGMTKCASAMLCLEGTVVDKFCKCARKTGGKQPDETRGRTCQSVMCPDGYACDPNTGTCRSLSGETNHIPGMSTIPVRDQSRMKPLLRMPTLGLQFEAFKSQMANKSSSLPESGPE